MERQSQLKLLTSAAGQRYVFDREHAKIGEGAFGVVYRGNVYLPNNTFGEVVAIKCVYRDQILKVGDELYKSIGSEVNILQQLVDLKPPHIIRIFDCFETKEYIHIILEYCNQGNLKDVTEKAGGKLAEATAIPIFFQILQAIDFLSRNDITHRDLKPENVFVKEGEYILGDFGFATAKKELDAFAGTLPYMAPEIVSDDPNYTKQVDVWALGIMLHETLFGEYPFKGSNMAMTRAISNDQYTIPSYPKISDYCKDLLLKCLVKDPSKRITAQGMMKHPLFAHLTGNSASPMHNMIDLKGSMQIGQSEPRNRSSFGLQDEEINQLHQSFSNFQGGRVQGKIQRICNLCMMFYNSIFKDIQLLGDKVLIIVRFYIIKYIFRHIYKLLMLMDKQIFPSAYLPAGDEIYWDTFKTSPLYNSVLNHVTETKKTLATAYDEFYKKEFLPYIYYDLPEYRDKLTTTYSNDIMIDFGVMLDKHMMDAEKRIRTKIGTLTNPNERQQWISVLLELKFFLYAQEAQSKRFILDAEKFTLDKPTMNEMAMINLIESSSFSKYIYHTTIAQTP